MSQYLPPRSCPGGQRTEPQVGSVFAVRQVRPLAQLQPYGLWLSRFQRYLAGAEPNERVCVGSSGACRYFPDLSILPHFHLDELDPVRPALCPRVRQSQIGVPRLPLENDTRGRHEEPRRASDGRTCPERCHEESTARDQASVFSHD